MFIYTIGDVIGLAAAAVVIVLVLVALLLDAVGRWQAKRANLKAAQWRGHR